MASWETMQETTGRLGNTNYEKSQNGVKIQLFCLVWLAYQSVNLVFSLFQLFVLLTGNGLGSVHLLAQILRRNNVQVRSFRYSCNKIKVCKTNITLPGPKGVPEIEIGCEIEKWILWAEIWFPTQHNAKCDPAWTITFQTQLLREKF